MDVENKELTAKGSSKGFLQCRYILVALVFFGYFNAFTMQSNLGVVIVAMVKSKSPNDRVLSDSCPMLGEVSNKSFQVAQMEEGEFDWDEYTQGVILSSFFYGYFVANLIGGRITEIIGVKLSLGGGILISTILTLLTPAAARFHYVALIIVRVLEGISQGSTSPGVNYLTGRWFHKKERGFLYSIMKSGINIGTVGASLISGFLVSSGFLGGWPSVFYVFGIIGAAWCIFWFLLMYEHPEAHPHISQEELNYIMDSIDDERQSQKQLSPPWKAILTSMPVWACVLVYLSENWGFNLLMCDQPAYMKNILHYDIEQNGLLSALPPIAQTIIAVLSGRITDSILSRTSVSDTVIRKWLVFLGSVLPVVCIIAVTQSGCNRLAVITLITLFLGLSGPIIPGVNVAIVNMAPAFSGTITGICNGFGEISGFVSPYIVGVLTENRQTIRQWNIVFYITAGVYIIPCIFFLIFGTSKLQPWSKETVVADERTHIKFADKYYRRPSINEMTTYVKQSEEHQMNHLPR